MSARALPTDVWAHVAGYLPTCERIPAFWALHRLGLIRKHRSIHESMMLFLTHSAQRDQQRRMDFKWPAAPTSAAVTLQSMGFAHDDIVPALTHAVGDHTLALDLLLFLYMDA